MTRRVISIDENRCDGCGKCQNACHEGAIGLVDGKAKLLRDDYCDGLGDCLPVCPKNAITFEEREAAPYDEAAVLAAKQSAEAAKSAVMTNPSVTSHESWHRQWPVKIALVSPRASYLQNCHLLISADCAAYTYAGLRDEFMRNKVVLIGCPKLGEDDHSQKLTDILRSNDIKSVTLVRMQVPCCGGLEQALKTALINSDKLISWSVVVISTDGNILLRQ